MSSVFLIAAYVLMLNSIASYEESDISGGHSRDFHVMTDDSSEWHRLFDDWHHSVRQRRDVENKPSLDDIKSYLSTFQTAFESAQKYIKNIVNNQAVVTGRIKKAYSIEEKLQRFNITLDNLTDVIGFRLTCQTVNQSLKFVKLIEESTDQFRIFRKYCYGMCPGYGKYNQFGYRRIHLIVMVKPQGKYMEIQIGTPYTNYWADWSHDFVYKGPKSFSKRTDVKTYSLELADYFWKLDEDRRHLPICPGVLANASALGILKESLPAEDAGGVFRKLGEPNNACFWWNDMKEMLTNKENTRPSSGAKTVVSETLVGYILWLSGFRKLFL